MIRISRDQQLLQDFFENSDLAEGGWVITDLDGTAIQEHRGVYTLPNTVEQGLKNMYDLGRPVVVNILRFPLSVIHTIGQDWYQISNKLIPTVLMNGSQLGYVVKLDDGAFHYEEIMAFPLQPDEISAMIKQVKAMLADGIKDLLVFYYPRQWTKGEIIWTPLAEKTKQVQQKYASAAQVYTGSIEDLHQDLLLEDVCMIFLLVDIPQDKMMAYQHTRKSNFFTHAGVDKLYGARQMADHLGLHLHHALGAGDAEMDSFLKGVGLPIHVANPNLSFQGIHPAIKVAGSSEMGELLIQLASLQKGHSDSIIAKVAAA